MTEPWEPSSLRAWQSSMPPPLRASTSCPASRLVDAVALAHGRHEGAYLCLNAGFNRLKETPHGTTGTQTVCSPPSHVHLRLQPQERRSVHVGHLLPDG